MCYPVQDTGEGCSPVSRAGRSGVLDFQGQTWNPLWAAATAAAGGTYLWELGSSLWATCSLPWSSMPATGERESLRSFFRALWSVVFPPLLLVVSQMKLFESFCDSYDLSCSQPEHYFWASISHHKILDSLARFPVDFEVQSVFCLYLRWILYWSSHELDVV